MTTDPTTPDEIVALIARCEAMTPLTPSQRVVLARAAHLEAFEPDDEIYREGAEGRDFLLVASGRLEARRATPFGEQRVALVGPGDLCGEISLLDGGPRSSTVIGLGPGHAARFTATRLQDLVEADPGLELGLLRAFCRSLASKIRQANVVMLEIMAPTHDHPEHGRPSQVGRPDAMDEAAKRRLLEEQGLFQRDLARLSSVLTAESFASGETIFAEGDPGDTLYLIADGRVRISRRIPGIGEEAITILERGDVFGEMAWIDSRPRSADAIAHSGGATVLGIRRSDLDGALGADSATGVAFLRALCELLCRRIRSMNDQLVAYRTLAWF